jgi:peroxiredoxin
VQLHRRKDELAARDAVVLAISFDPEPLVREFCRNQPWHLDCLVDERRTAYRAYGLTRGSWLQTLTPRALAPYIRLIFRGRAIRAAPGQDIRQRGGDFVVGRDGRLTLAHPSDDPADRPDVASIIEACR